MAAISAALVKELREKTGAGMMDCKKALTETDGDIEGAVDWLRKSGLAAAAKKAGRVASEGLVGLATQGNRGAAVEINSETDFVARNEVFQEFVSNCATLALDTAGDLDKLLAAAYPGGSNTVSEQLTHMIATVGENMSLRRTALIEVKQGVVASYIHNRAAPGLGKIGVLVGLQSSGDQDKLATLGRELAMHVAAAKPQAVDVGDLDPGLLQRERDILSEQARASGKPEEIIAKMVEGRLRKFYEEACLMEQVSFHEAHAENKVRKVLELAAKDLGSPVELTGFVSFRLGEGVEGETED
jgi:elongation factor Ts